VVNSITPSSIEISAVSPYSKLKADIMANILETLENQSGLRSMVVDNKITIFDERIDPRIWIMDEINILEAAKPFPVKLNFEAERFKTSPIFDDDQ
jgi:hypothetical protein